MIDYRTLRQYAETESVRLNHYYLGVEHLVIALLSQPTSLLSQALHQQGVHPAYVSYRLTDALGQTLDRRYWEGFQQSPRYNRVFDAALAKASNQAPREIEILESLLEDGASFPIRVWNELDIDLEKLWHDVHTPKQPESDDTSLPTISTQIALRREECALLEQCFKEYTEIQVLAEFANMHSPGRYFLVQPLQGDIPAALNIVKFADARSIMQEKHQLDLLSENLPATALPTVIDFRLDTSGQHGLLRYLLAEAGETVEDLLGLCRRDATSRVSDIMSNTLLDDFYKLWWEDRSRYRFGLWREYDLILPPTLVINYRSGGSNRDIYPLQEISHMGDLAVGMNVTLRDFNCHQHLHHRQAVVLSAGRDPEAVNRSSQIEVRDIPDRKLVGITEGQSVGKIGGVIIETRETLLINLLKSLEPPFDSHDYVVESPLGDFPNPILALDDLLTHEVDGYLTRICGALTLGNIVTDENSSVMLLDYRQTRQGHLLFDWAMLEMSIITDYLAEKIDTSWDAAWELGEAFLALNEHEFPTGALQLIETIRNIAGRYLSTLTEWQEYHAALCLIGLGAFYDRRTHGNASRLAFVASTIALHSFQKATE